MNIIIVGALVYGLGVDEPICTPLVTPLANINTKWLEAYPIIGQHYIQGTAYYSHMSLGCSVEAVSSELVAYNPISPAWTPQKPYSITTTQLMTSLMGTADDSHAM